MAKSIVGIMIYRPKNRHEWFVNYFKRNLTLDSNLIFHETLLNKLD